MLAILPALGAVLVAGCAGKGLEAGPAGLAPGDAARVSLVVAETRAQFPQYSAAGLSSLALPLPEALAAPQRVLQGEGPGYSRGFQTAQGGRVRLMLFLDKSSYARGYAQVSLDGAAEQTWPIIAFDQRGRAGEAFEFIYLLAGPAGAPRYLAVAGGPVRADNHDFLALEGHLIVPDASLRPENWQHAYTVDFGFRHAMPPAYQDLVEQAQRLLQDWGREVTALDGLRQRIEAAERDAAAAAAAASAAPAAGAGAPSAGAPAAGAGAPAAGAAQAEAARAQDRLQGLRDDLTARAAAASALALRTFEVSRAADAAFMAFAESNAFSWAQPGAQQAYFDRWQSLAGQRPRVEQLLAELLPYAKEPAKLEQAQQAAQTAMARNGNFSRNPALKAAAAKP